MTYKQRTIVCRKDGTDRVEYWVVDDSGTVKTCAPIAWLKLNLEDRTTDRTAERVAELRYKSDRSKRPFGRRVDDNLWARENKIPENLLYRTLCNQFGIRY